MGYAWCVSCVREAVHFLCILNATPRDRWGNQAHVIWISLTLGFFSGDKQMQTNRDHVRDRDLSRVPAQLGFDLSNYTYTSLSFSFFIVITPY